MKMYYMYGMRLRGFSPGCQPKAGFVERLDGDSGKYHDILLYNRILSDKELMDYELDFLTVVVMNEMLMLSLDDAVDVARRLVKEEMDDVTIIRQELEQKCWFPPEAGEAAKRLNDLIFDINPAEICRQIESDNLREWCRIVQTEMKMALIQLPCWAEESQ